MCLGFRRPRVDFLVVRVPEKGWDTHSSILGLPWRNPPAMGTPGLDPWVGKILWSRARQPASVFLPRESPWTQEPGGLQSMGVQRVGYDWAIKHSTAHKKQSILIKSIMLIMDCGWERGGKEVQEGGDISILTFDSHWCMAETSTTL